MRSSGRTFSGRGQHVGAAAGIELLAALTARATDGEPAPIDRLAERRRLGQDTIMKPVRWCDF